jgi:hypothetical protein
LRKVAVKAQRDLATLVVSSGWKDIYAEISPFNTEAEKLSLRA